jgi:hypothetical protein
MIEVKSTTRVANPIAETNPDLDIREVPRAACLLRPSLRVMVRPSFLPLTVLVQDISSKGVGLLCESHMPPGTELAILWMYGPPEEWRTLRAKVVRLSPRRDGGWVAGCVFAARLFPGELETFLRYQGTPVSARWRFDD